MCFLLPKIFPVNHHNGRNSSIKVVKQPRIDADTARGFVPAAIRLKSRTVAVSAASAGSTKVVRHEFALPPVNRITCGACQVKLFGRIIRIQHAAL